MRNTCSVVGCERLAYGRGFCGMHWLRWRRHGDPLYSAPVGGWPKHGHCTRTRRTLEYSSWLNMKSRCLNPKYPRYANYGGRGIQICRRWMDSFKDFLRDVGLRPSATHSLDRIDVNGNYEPGNVRWATKSEQQRNRRVNVKITVDGQDYLLDELAERYGLKGATLRGRLNKGMEIHAALTFPLQRGVYLPRKVNREGGNHARE